jgi:hypothetical protein
MTVDEALGTLFGEVPKEYSAAIRARWKSLRAETLAERRFNGELKPAEARLRHHISDTLLSRKTRRAHPEWWLQWDSTRLHYVNFDTQGGKRREVVGPYLKFSLWVGRGARISIEMTLESSAQLEEMLARVLWMAEES